MFSFYYKLTTYANLLKDIGRFFNVPVEQDSIVVLPPEAGTGCFKAFDLGGGIEALLYNMRLNDDLIMRREKNATEYYTLNLDELDKSGSASITIENDTLGESFNRSHAFFLTSFLFDIETCLQKNTELKGLRVLLNTAWMQQYLQIPHKDDVLKRYINLKTEGILQKSVDAETRELLNGLFEQDDAPLLYYQNKIMRIVEKFFSWLYDEMQMLEDKSGISRQDIESAQQVEAILTSDTTVIPPTIAELSRKVAMSESKLKKIFKIVFGLPPYEYFQKQRMQKARMMLLSGKYSIKDVGYTLGYANLSNFTLAFKKEFAQLPSEVVKKHEP